MKQKLKNLWQFFIDKINNYLLDKSFTAAKRKCVGSNKKMWIVMHRGNYEAISKEQFKEFWRSNPAAKKLSIQDWEQHITEFKN